MVFLEPGQWPAPYAHPIAWHSLALTRKWFQLVVGLDRRDVADRPERALTAANCSPKATSRLQDVERVAAQPVQLPDHDGVAVSHVGHQVGQTGTIVTGTGHDVRERLHYAYGVAEPPRKAPRERLSAPNVVRQSSCGRWMRSAGSHSPTARTPRT
jgi:hypothetical protein